MLVLRRGIGHGRSNIREKLEFFINTGDIRKFLDRELAAKTKKNLQKKGHIIENAGVSPQKALHTLQARYDLAMLKEPSGEIIDLFKLKPLDLRVDSPKSLSIFHALMAHKKATRKPVELKLLHFLLGVTPAQLKDPYTVTKEALKLLHRDNSIDRAQLLCMLARENGAVGMNAVMQWCFEHGNVQEGQKCMNNRKKWAIPTNTQTHVLYFSGMASAHPWGKLSDATAATLVNYFDSLDRPRHDVFNACLSALMKNFSHNQLTAWSFFDRLEEAAIFPTSHTFTIFLHGVRQLFRQKTDEIQALQELSATERTRKLLENQKDLLKIANKVWEKVMLYAVPPKTARLSPNDFDPALYDKEKTKPVLDIDPPLVTAFVSCFIAASAGTSVTANLGSHYLYNMQGLDFLKIWVPEIEAALHFARPHDAQKWTLGPAPVVKSRTDARLDAASVGGTELDPKCNVKEVSMQEYNPIVEYHVPSSHPKGTNRFYGSPVRLVDFSRPKMADVRRLAAAQKFKNTKGKMGAPLRSKDPERLVQNSPLNAFIIAPVLEALVSLGRLREFYMVMWYFLTTYGGIFVSRSRLRERLQRGLVGPISPKDIYDETKSFDEKERLTPRHNNEVVDISLVENCIHKMYGSFSARMSPPMSYIGEVLGALVGDETNISRSLLPREKTYDAVFSVFKRYIYQFNDINWENGIVQSKQTNVANNTAKKSLTKTQLRELLHPMAVVMECLTKQQNGKLLPVFLPSYASFINTIYQYTWLDAQETHPAHIDIHKWIIKTGMSFYRPSELIDKSAPYSPAIYKSLSVVYDRLKNTDGLTKQDIQLMLALRSLFQVPVDASDATERVDALAKKIATLDFHYLE